MSKVAHKCFCDQLKFYKDYSLIPVPLYENEFRQYFDGRHAIYNNVLIPKINILENRDMYVLLFDFLQMCSFILLVMPSIVKALDGIKSFHDGGISDLWQTKKSQKHLSKLNIQDKLCYKILLCKENDRFDQRQQ